MSFKNVFIGPFERIDPAPGVLRVALKDNIDIAGHITTAGSRSRQAAAPAEEDAAVVTLLRNAGVRIVGKTHLDEFACSATGCNPWFGNVVNPRDPHRIIGGSSGGSAAAVAHGAADFALGTDTGGSVRIPAALSAIAGLKTTKGLLSNRGVHPLAEGLDVLGPMAPNIAGLRVAMNILAPEYADQAPAPFRPAPVRVARLRFPEPETIVDEALDAAIAATGWQVENLTLPGWAQAYAASYLIIARQCWINNRRYVQELPGDVGDIARTVMDDGARITVADYRDALGFASQWAHTIEELFDTFEALLCPTVSDLAPKFSDLRELNWASFARTMQFNLSGHPALTLPLDLPSTHLTGSVQIVGPYGSDFHLLTLGAHMERQVSST